MQVRWSDKVKAIHQKRLLAVAPRHPNTLYHGIVLQQKLGDDFFPRRIKRYFLGGVRVIDTVHVLIFIVFVFYMFVHVYLGSLGHTRTTHYKAMITGYEDVEEEPEVKA